MPIQYETNVRHRGAVFRIRTEVVVAGHILTQLLSAEDVVLVTRMALGEEKAQLQEMHRGMFRALSEGRLEEDLRRQGRGAS